MTKKEREEMERKQKKKNKSKNIIILILAVLLIILLVFFLYKEDIIKFGKENPATTEPSNSVSDNIDDYTNNNELSINSNESTENTSESNEPTSDKDTSKNEEESKNNNNEGVYSASLPLTVNDAMSILNSRYGKGYTINRSTQNGEYTNFAVYKDDERYATVSVNLSTGDASEMIIDSGNQTKFNLLK